MTALSRAVGSMRDDEDGGGQAAVEATLGTSGVKALLLNQLNGSVVSSGLCCLSLGVTSLTQMFLAPDLYPAVFRKPSHTPVMCGNTRRPTAFAANLQLGKFWHGPAHACRRNDAKS
jgi:hypothetical protein